MMLLLCYFCYFAIFTFLYMMLLLCYFCYFAIFTFLYMMLLLCYFCYFAIFNSPYMLLILCYFCYFALLDHPFLRNLAKKGSLGAKILLDNVKFMVDLWHCEKHKEATCMPYLDNPKCIYHPKLSSFSAVHCVNTECAEQAFKWLGKFKFIARKMTRQRFCFFLWKMINEHNQRVCRKLQMEKKIS